MDEEEGCVGGGGPMEMSIQQVELFDYLLTHTWAETMANFGMRSADVFRTCVQRTALGYYWSPDMKCAGRLHYLAYDYEQRLVHIINDKAEDHACCTIAEVQELARLLRAEQFSNARASLMKRNCPRLAAKMTESDEGPSLGWIHNMVSRNDLRIVAGQDMDRVRSLACEQSRVIEYFLGWMATFNRDPRLIFGADETDVRPSFRPRVITNNNQQGHTENVSQLKHLSAMCAHSAGGIAVPPMFILEDLQNLPSELRDSSVNGPQTAWYVSTSSGWMTEGAFYEWAMLFVCWLSEYRQMVLPPSIRMDNILLIMDGHTSRRCPSCIPLFLFHNVSVLILPAHMTHLLQAFDVVLAAPLKCYFRRFLSSEKKANAIERFGSYASWSRRVTVCAFLRAWRTVTSGPLCSRSFEKVGVFPPDAFRVSTSPFVVDHKVTTIEEKSEISNEMLTTIEMYQRLFRLKSEKGGRLDIVTPEFSKYPNTWVSHIPTVSWMHQQTTGWGRLLSDPPPLLYTHQGQLHNESFNMREIPRVIPPDNILEMMRRLSLMEEQRVTQLVTQLRTEQEENNARLQAHVIETAAHRLAQNMALKIANDRSSAVAKLMTQNVMEFMRQSINENTADGNTQVRDTLLSNLDSICNACAQKLSLWCQNTLRFI